MAAEKVLNVRPESQEGSLMFRELDYRINGAFFGGIVESSAVPVPLAVVQGGSFRFRPLAVADGTPSTA